MPILPYLGIDDRLMPYKGKIEVAPPAQSICLTMKNNCIKLHACITKCIIIINIIITNIITVNIKGKEKYFS